MCVRGRREEEELWKEGLVCIWKMVFQCIVSVESRRFAPLIRNNARSDPKWHSKREWEN